MQQAAGKVPLARSHNKGQRAKRLRVYSSLRQVLFVRGLLKWRNQLIDSRFPWRTSTNPFGILIAELMLQRTQAQQVVPTYERFIAAYPTPEALNAATDVDLLELLAGLGLKKRFGVFRRLGADLMQCHGGLVPESMEALLRLFGVGPYTAAAVMCFAFGAPEALIDANVERVLARALRIIPGGSRARTDRYFRKRVVGLVPRQRARDFNLALVDLGITVCRSRVPLCHLCPIAWLCMDRSTKEGILSPLQKLPFDLDVSVIAEQDVPRTMAARGGGDRVNRSAEQ